MNATRFASFFTAFIAAGLAAGCAYDRGDRAMHSTAPMTPVATAPMVQQPVPAVTYAPAPAPMATAAADPAVGTMPPTVVATASNGSMSNNMMNQRAPRADRN